MAERAWNVPARWRAFAEGVAAALGVNVWVSVVLLPGLFVGAFRAGPVLGLSLLPLVVLALGLWRRSESVLLLLYPSSLLVPVGFAPAMAGAHVYGPIRFTVVGVGLVAYLLGVSFFAAFREPRPPVGVRPLSSTREATPERWRRRQRVYRGLVALSILVPAVLLWQVNFDARNQAYLAEMFPGRVAAMTTVLNLGAVGVWVGLYAHAFLGVLRPHRSGDRDLVTRLAAMREQARRGRPRPVFYLAVAASLGFMILFLWSRQP